MANIIHVTPAKLSSTAAGFESAAAAVRNLTGQMTAVVRQLTGRVWSGEAAAAYVGKFNALQGDMDQMYNMIRKHSTQLQQIAKEFESAETANTAESGRLSGNVIA